MENLWETIAKARGVKLNEEFKWRNLIYKVTDCDGLLVLDGSWVRSGYTLGFIKGEGKIERTPFVPKIGEKYWTYNAFSIGISISSYNWTDTFFDKERKLLGIIFRTEQEAKDYLPTWKKRLEGEEP